MAVWKPPPRDPLRDPAALLTQEGNLSILKFNIPAPYPPIAFFRYLPSSLKIQNTGHAVETDTAFYP